MQREPHGRQHLPIEEEKVRVIARAHGKASKCVCRSRGELEVIDDGVVVPVVAQEEFDLRVIDDRVDGLALEKVIEALGDHPHREVELPHLAPTSTEEAFPGVVRSQKLVYLVNLNERAPSSLCGTV